MNSNNYPKVAFTLDSGRVLEIHGMTWEPTYNEERKYQVGNDYLKLEINRKRLETADIFSCSSRHVIGPEYVDMYINDPPRIQNTAIRVSLASGPISKEAVFSELVVLFFIDHIDGASLEKLLEHGLHALDWEKYAMDVSLEDIRELESSWSESSLH